MTAVLTSFYQIDKRWLFVIFNIYAITVSVIIQEFIIYEGLYYDYFSEQMSYDRISGILEIMGKWKFYYYFLIPVVYIIKFFGISLCIISGALLSNKHLSFKKVFHATVLGEFIFLLPQLFSIVWFLFINPSYDLNELRFFEPLSLLSFTSDVGLQSWLIYPLKSANLFEFFYIVIIGAVLKEQFDGKFFKSLKVVAPSYLIGFLVWIIFISFITLNITT